jgi:shikimate dehydrogenase
MRKYGLIGYPLTHSFSQRYFTEKFGKEGLTDVSYSNFPLAGIGELPEVFSDPELCGLNITIPYKEQVIPFLQEMDEVVSIIGACNCIHIVRGRIKGYNTDVTGFSRSLEQKLTGHHRQALVLGTGGAAKAVEYVLRNFRIPYQSVSRQPRPLSGAIAYEGVDARMLATHQLIINTTPLGMYPHTEECPLLPYEALTPEHYLFDLIYNPAKTLFLQKGEARGAVVQNGYDMLILQAEESWRIWNSSQ